ALLPPVGVCKMESRSKELFQRICGEMVLPNMIILGAAISSCEKGSQWKPALALLHFGQQEDVYMDVICYSAAISACEKCSMWQTAFFMLEDMRRSLVRCDTVALCSSISACEKSSEWQMAVETHLQARSVHLQPDIIACNAAMSSCAKRNRWAHASLLLAAAEEPSVVSCSVAIAACTAFWELAMAFLTFMAMCRLTANAASRSSAADACAGAGRWRLALRAAQSAKGGGAANAALRGLAEATEWSAALAFLGRITPDATSYCSIIESCSSNALHMTRLLSDVQQLELRVLPLRCAPRSLTSFAKEKSAEHPCLTVHGGSSLRACRQYGDVCGTGPLLVSGWNSNRSSAKFQDKLQIFRSVHSNPEPLLYNPSD
ncbi:MRL1, partial [Symbiodinium sp. CCMP2456]